MLSDKVASYLIKNKNIVDKDEQEIIFFGAEVFFGMMLGIFVTMLIAYFLNIHTTVFWMLLASLLIRKTGGGAHSNNPLNCLLITIMIYNLLAYIGILSFNFVENYIQTIVIIVFLLCLITLVLKSPVESPQKPLAVQQRSLLRKLSFIAIVIIFSFQMLVLYKLNPIISYSVSLIILWQSLMLTSVGHQLIGKLDTILDCFLKKRRCN